MKADRIFAEFNGRITAEISRVTAQADVGGNLAGLSWQFHGKDKDGTERHFWPYFRVAGVGADPSLGGRESDAITFRADAAGDLASTYFTLHDGSALGVESDRYVFFRVAGAGYDPGLGQQEQTTVQAIDDVAGALNGCYFTFEDGAGNLHYAWFHIAGMQRVDPRLGLPEISRIGTLPDVAGSLNSTYFTFEDGAGNPFYAWFNVGGAGIDPAIGGSTGLEVAILANATAPEVAAALMAVLDARPEFIATGLPAANELTLTNLAAGVAVDIADGAAPTGFNFLVLLDGIDPILALAAGVGLETPIWVGITAEEIVQRMIATFALSWAALFTVDINPGAPDTLLIVNNTYGVAADAADGAGGLATGFAFVTTVQGVDPLPALLGYTLLAAVDVGLGDPDEAVAAAFALAVNGLEGWAAVARAAPNDEIVDLLHPTLGNPTDTADGNVGGVFAVAVTTGVDPDPTFHSIPVDIAVNAAAAVVAAAIRAAIRVHTLADGMVDCAGVDPAVDITNRWPGTVTNIADVDTGWAFATVTAGVAAVVTNMNVNVATALYVVKPDLDETIFLRQILIQLSDTDVTNGAEFGDLGIPLANGLYWAILDRDGAVVRAITPVIKTNAELAALGATVLLGTTTMIVLFDAVAAFGGEVAVDGRLGHYLACVHQDNPNGLTTFYSDVRGHVETNRYTT